MTEDNQENEMEDILSSIKNILEEDEQRQKSPSSDDIDILGDVLNSSDEVDDILELSPSMRIEETFTATPVVDENLGDVPVTAEPMPVADENKFEDNDIDIGIVDEGSDSFFNAEKEAFASANEPLSTIDEVLAEDSLADNIEIVADEPVSDSDLIPEVEPVAEAEIVTNEPVSEPEQPSVIAEIVETVSEVISEPEITSEPEKTTEDVTDVSANIISNFAKMFSREETKSEAPADNEIITSVGNSEKTLEQFVLDAVIKVVGNEIQKQWNNGADYQSFAEAEITRQTSAWINDNLPALVEKIVKQEIERVIAKVGS